MSALKVFANVIGLSHTQIHNTCGLSQLKTHHVFGGTHESYTLPRNDWQVMADGGEGSAFFRALHSCTYKQHYVESMG